MNFSHWALKYFIAHSLQLVDDTIVTLHPCDSDTPSKLLEEGKNAGNVTVLLIKK